MDEVYRNRPMMELEYFDRLEFGEHVRQNRSMLLQGQVSPAVAGLAMANLYQTCTFIAFIMKIKSEYRNTDQLNINHLSKFIRE